MDTLLPTQMFPRLLARATFVADTNFMSGTQKMFLILYRNILCPQQMFPSLRSSRNIMGNNVSATMCPRLPGSLHIYFLLVFNCAKRSKLTIFSFEPQGHVIDHALECERTITWIPTTKTRRKVKSLFLNL